MIHGVHADNSLPNGFVKDKHFPCRGAETVSPSPPPRFLVCFCLADFTISRHILFDLSQMF
jgi:hypothetical protein